MSRTTINNTNNAQRILYRTKSSTTRACGADVTKEKRVKARENLEQKSRGLQSDLNRRQVRQSNGKARLAGKIHPLEVAHKASTAGRVKIKRLTKETKNGILLNKIQAKIYAGQIKESGTCSIAWRGEIERTVNLNKASLEEKTQAFQNGIKEMSDVPMRQEMKQALKSVNNQLKLEENSWNVAKQSFDYVNDAKEDFKVLAALSSKLQKKGKLSKKETENFNRILWNHKQNIPILLEHLSKFQNATPASHIVEAAMLNLADLQLSVADFMSLHSGSLSDRPPLDRQSRIAYHLLQAQSARQVVFNIKENYFPGDVDVGVELDKIDAKLSSHEKILMKLKDNYLPEDIKDIKYLLEMPVTKQKKLSDILTDYYRERLVDSKKIPAAIEGMTQRQMLGVYLTGAIEAGVKSKNGLPDMEFLQTMATVKAINNQNWDPINKKIKIEIDGTKASFKSQINPAGEHSARLSEPYDGNGVGSEDRLQYKHAINLAQTKLVNEKGETIFSSHRSGVLDPYKMTVKNLKKLSDSQLTEMLGRLLVESGLRNQGSLELLKEFRGKPKTTKVLAALMRKQASRVMAQDAAATMLLNDPELLAKAERGEVVELPITSISLMTPDYLTALGSKAGEQEMLENHREALKELGNAGEAISLPIRDKKGSLKLARVKVIPDVMSFGVNAGALRGFGVIGGNRLPFWRRLMGWGLSARMNDPVLTGLVGSSSVNVVSGKAGLKISSLKRKQGILRESIKSEKLAANDLATITQRQGEIDNIQKQISKITQLSEQIQSIRKSKSFMREANDPYKMPARIALLVDAIGGKVLVHCKSGKDRTGQTDVEAKYLASVFDMTGKFPKPGTKPNKQSIELRTKFAMEAGNHEMQQYNTGLPGFKLIGVPALDKQIKANALSSYRGGSRFVKT